MANSIEQVKEATKAKLLELGMKESDIDLSYITDALIAESTSAKKKDTMPTSSPAALAGQPNYFGNRLAHVSGNVWSWTNSNPSTTSDLPSHKCGSGYRWQASLSAYNTGAGWGCPGNNPPGGFQGWA